jgi:hypothetical protein
LDGETRLSAPSKEISGFWHRGIVVIVIIVIVIIVMRVRGG